MSKLTVEEIRKRFETSNEFNEIFDAFEQALEQQIKDLELYRLLFWNPKLTPDELCLFGEKLAQVFPELAYDTYMWLASVFEVTHSIDDNYELALKYYKKAADTKPEEINPYLYASDCYEQDLNIPPLNILIDFLKQGTNNVPDPTLLYEKLAHLYEIAGNDEMSIYYKRKLEKGPTSPESLSTEE